MEKNIYKYTYILSDLWGAACYWDTILCIDVFAIQCNSERSRNSVWFIKQWFVLIGTLLLCACLGRSPVLFPAQGARRSTQPHSAALIRFSRFSRRHGQEWEWVGRLCEGSKSVFVEEVKEPFYPRIRPPGPPIRCSWVCRPRNAAGQTRRSSTPDSDFILMRAGCCRADMSLCVQSFIKALRTPSLSL